MLSIKGIPPVIITKKEQATWIDITIMEKFLHWQITIQQFKIWTIAIENDNNDVINGRQLWKIKLNIQDSTTIKIRWNHTSQKLKQLFKTIERKSIGKGRITCAKVYWGNIETQ